MAKSGKFWREHHSPGLAIGKKQVAELEKHYAAHGIHVDHRETACGDYEPILKSESDFNRCCEARGIVNYNK